MCRLIQPLFASEFGPATTTVYARSIRLMTQTANSNHFLNKSLQAHALAAIQLSGVTTICAMLRQQSTVADA